MKIEPAAALVGHVAVPGDKSISHRAVLLGALAEGETRVLGFGRSADTEATVRITSSDSSRPAIRVSPSTIAPRITARCEIDLSPGTAMSPLSGRPGWAVSFMTG